MKRFMVLLVLTAVITSVLLADDEGELKPEKKQKLNLSGLVINTLSIMDMDGSYYGNTTGIGWGRTFGLSDGIGWVGTVELSVPLFRHSGEGRYGFGNTEFRNKYTPWVVGDLGYGLSYDAKTGVESGIRSAILGGYYIALGKNINGGLGFGALVDFYQQSGWHTEFSLYWYPWVISEVNDLGEIQAIQIRIMMGFSGKD